MTDEHGETHGSLQTTTPDGAPETDEPPTPGRAPLPVRVVPERLGEARTISEEIIRWVERADLKATVLITGVGVVFGGEVLMLIEMTKLGAKGFDEWLPIAFLIASMAVLIVAGWLAAAAVYPRLGTDYVYRGEVAPGDLLFFGRLRAIPPTRFAEHLDEAIEQDLLVHHYAEQIHFNAGVAWKKYEYIRASLRVFAVAGVLALGSVVTFALIAPHHPHS
jgi:amino acid transporter